MCSAQNTLDRINAIIRRSLRAQRNAKANCVFGYDEWSLYDTFIIWQTKINKFTRHSSKTRDVRSLDFPAFPASALPRVCLPEQIKYVFSRIETLWGAHSVINESSVVSHNPGCACFLFALFRSGKPLSLHQLCAIVLESIANERTVLEKVLFG